MTIDKNNPVFGSKIKKQYPKRGWTEENIIETVQNPARTAATRDERYNPDGTKKNEPATVYYRTDGHYVTVNDLTRDIVQISDLNDPDWIDPFGVKIGGD